MHSWKKTNYITYCKDCNLQVELVEEGTYNVTTPASHGQDPVDTLYHIDAYILLRCPKCSAPFLYLKQYSEIPAEYSIEQCEPKILYPSANEIPLELVPATIKGAFEDALQAHKVGLYSPSVLMCRKTIEAVCYEKGIKNGKLKQKLKLLKEREIIDNNMYSWADGLRLIGNEAAHDLLPNISKEDSHNTIDFTESIILAVFVLSNKFEKFKKRRNKQKQ